MYTMTLEVNQKCNLNCTYCYLGEKNGSKMSIDTAYKGVDMAFEKVRAHRDRELLFDFVGGESFIDFPMIKEIISYIEEKNQKANNYLRYSVTTNATLFNQAIVDFLVEKNFSLKISIDGTKEVNDRNRVSKTKYSVHDRIISQLCYVREFEKRTNKLVQVTNVVTNNNYQNYAESVEYLVTEVGFRLIDTGIDYYSEWTEQEMNGLASEIRKIFDFFIKKAYQGKGFRWSFASSLVEMRDREPCKKFYECGAGIVSSYVRHDGSLYACPGNLDKQVELGDIDAGFDSEKINWLKQFDSIKNERCRSCAAYNLCTEKSCVMMNIAKTGNPHEPAPMLCWTRLLMVDIYKENEEVISRLTM